MATTRAADAVIAMTAIPRPGAKSGVRSRSAHAQLPLATNAPARSSPPIGERDRRCHSSTVPPPTSAPMAGARITL